ncbi:hypothetical protein B0H14DRAFT_2603448 [Mycena olivaceomarginata]|nr:hypothetical protein B0H14DRAFT_2603448 [Mycena olivaceomarginata]
MEKRMTAKVTTTTMDSMEAQVRRDEESTFVRANLAQAQEQWLKGGPRPRVPTPPPFRWLEDRASPHRQVKIWRTKSQALRPRRRSILPPPSSKTTVAYVISARIRRYFDEQAEDSDEDAGEEREEEEQEMEEDREFVDDTAVDEDFVHRLPSNKDDAREVEKWVAHFQNKDNIAHYKRDVAREAAGEAGAPSAEQKRMLSPRELVLYNKAKNLRTNMQIAEFERALHWEMLADVDVEPHTWVRAPDQFDCRVGRYPAREGLGASANVQYVAEMVSQSGAFLRGNRAVRGKHAEWIIASRARKAVSRSRRWGSRCGDDGGSEGFYRHNNRGKRVAMAQVLPPAPKPYPKGKGPIAPVKPPKPFEVGLAQLKRHALDLYYHFRIHDRVRVVSGALYVGAIGRVEEVEGDFLTVAIPKDWEVAGATWPSPPPMLPNFSLSALSTLLVSGPSETPFALREGSTRGKPVTWSYSRHEDVPHSRKVRCSDVDFEHELWTTTATNRLPSASWSESDNDLTPRTSQRGFEGIEVIVAKSNDFIALSKEAKKRERGEGHIHIPHKGSHRFHAFAESDVAGIMVTIRGDHSLETVQVPIENVRHLVQYDGVLGQGSFFSARHFVRGANRLNHPRITHCHLSRAPSAATPKRHHLLPDLQLPSPRMRLYGDHIHRWKGENNGRWLCQPELVGRRLDVQILGIATLANSTISKVQRTLEGSCGWVLLSEPVTTKTRKVDVCSVGKKPEHVLHRQEVASSRDGTSTPENGLVEITERVVIIGPDRESDRASYGASLSNSSTELTGSTP